MGSEWCLSPFQQKGLDEGLGRTGIRKGLD